MSDEALERFWSGRELEPHLAGVAPPIESDTEDLGCFGVLRGVAERAVALELRQRDGSIKAIGYAWIERYEYEPSEGIKLFASGTEIAIIGRNLNKEVRANLRLFEAIVRHRVPWLCEVDESAALQAPKTATLIESIQWKIRSR
jgi:hypothetical protein